jgi:disulfide bond formation protein DsbB
MKLPSWWLIFLAWIVATLATLGSLFFSEVMHYPPCVLCWYQRICMYPLCFIFLMGMFPLNKFVTRYSLPLAITGWFISFYHNLLYYKILPESAGPCVKGISCTTVFFNWFGFITIPLLSLISFSLILILIFLTRRSFQIEN